LAISYITFFALDKAASPTSTPFELPEQLSFVSRLIDFLPGGAVLIFVGMSISFTLVPYFFLKMRGSTIPFSIILRAAAYQQGAIIIPPLILVEVLVAFLPPLSAYALILVAPSNLFAVYWLIRQIKYEGYRGGVAIFLGMIVPGTLMLVLQSAGLMPTKPYLVRSNTTLPTLNKGDVVVVNMWAYRWRKPKYGELVVAQKIHAHGAFRRNSASCRAAR
jgi:hypothetical protein